MLAFPYDLMYFMYCKISDGIKTERGRSYRDVLVFFDISPKPGTVLMDNHKNERINAHE